ncbi:MAG: folate-binding protein [Alphaproteobacteria bacterium]|nr:MAG: folate-binding protein [Alphaproteobacteria bacterium]
MEQRIDEAEATRLSAAAPAGAERVPGRRVRAVRGPDRERFLQGLVTNDVRRLAEGPLYAALLTPQGKYLADFFLVAVPEAILIDVAAPLADDLARRLAMYRLRAAVEITPLDLPVWRGLGPVPEGAWADPRHPLLGWRAISEAPPAGLAELAPGEIDWDALRVALIVPESGIELIPNESYILEAGFERLNGVDFRKGCYVGQEVTARMKHKASLRKGLVRVRLEGEPPPPGTPVTREGREVGRLFTAAGGRALAHLRFDRIGEGMRAGAAALHLDGAAEGAGG